MFLRRIVERNPGLIKATVAFHQAGEIPPNTWVFDLDMIAENAKFLGLEAQKYGLTTYLMTKQINRNPFVTRVAIKQGLHKAVAVDVQGAKILHRYQVPIGHVGHLCQIPKGDIATVLDMGPEVITIYSVEEARMISEAAEKKGKIQDLLVRMVGPNDIFFPSQEGGLKEKRLIGEVRKIQSFSNVQVRGVTSFPCITYNRTKEDPVEPTPNFSTIVRAANLLRDKLGIEITQINAPGNTSSETFPLLAQKGATHAEPGHGLLGTTPNHMFRSNLPERPTYVYLTEMSHHVGNEAYAFGGGFWSDLWDLSQTPLEALVGRTFDQCLNNAVSSVPKKTTIDYHVALTPGERCKIGSSVVFGFRTQMQMTRSQVAVVSGIRRNQPILEAIFDCGGTMIDGNYNPVDTLQVLERIESVLEKY